jgi:hypothetical protein
MRPRTRKLSNASQYEVAVSGRRRKQDAPNSLKFLADIEGVPDFDGRVRGANGIKWKVA